MKIRHNCYYQNYDLFAQIIILNLVLSLFKQLILYYFILQITEDNDNQYYQSRLLIAPHNSMPYEFHQFQTKYPQQYNTLQARTNTAVDPNKRQLYFYTIAKKEGWLSTNPINLVIKQPQQVLQGNQYVLYYEKLLFLDEEFYYTPVLQPHSSIKIINIKMLARQSHILTIAYMSQAGSLQEWHIHFCSPKVSQAWQVLLKNKKAEAIKIRNKNQDRDELIKKLNTQLKVQQGQLHQSRVSYDKLLLELSLLKDEKDRYKQLSRFLQEQLIILKDFVDKCIAQKEQISSAKEKEYGQLIKLKDERLKQNRKSMDCQIERCLLEKQKIEAQMSLRKEIIDLKILNARSSQQRDELLNSNKQMEMEILNLRQEIYRKDKQHEYFRKDESIRLSKSTCIISDHDHRSESNY